MSGQYSPGGHGMHAPSPVVLANVPRGQSIGVIVPSGQCLPTPQTPPVQSERHASAQSSCTAASAPPMQNDPAAHGPDGMTRLVASQ